MIQRLSLIHIFHGVEVLKGIDAEIDRGEVVCVIGPSGSGKSTFLRCLNLLEKPTEGHIFFEGDDLTDPKINLNLHRQKMGMVFQQFNLFPHMSIMENLTCAPVMLKKMTKEQAQNKALELLGKVGLQEMCIRDSLNYRASFWKGRESELSDVFKEIVSASDILIGNEEDYQLCLGIKGPEAGGVDVASKIDSFKDMIERTSREYPNVSAVSYTHLDVYKRQEILRGAGQSRPA